jgi:hypothetical protein
MAPSIENNTLNLTKNCAKKTYLSGGNENLKSSFITINYRKKEHKSKPAVEADVENKFKMVKTNANSWYLVGVR